MPAATLADITRSLLAVLVVAGGGGMIALLPDSREAVVGLVGMVIGFYFNQTNTLRAYGEGLQAQKGENL